MKPNKNHGARRELRLALRAVRTAITHAGWCINVQHTKEHDRAAIGAVRRDLYALEEQICRRIGVLR